MALALSGVAIPVSAVSPPAGVQSQFTVPHVSAQLLVKTAPGVLQSAITEVLAPFGGVVAEYSATADLYAVDIDDDTDLGAAVGALEADPRFDFAQPNYILDELATPNDLDFSQQWSKENLGFNAPGGLGTPGADMNLVTAWDTRSVAPGIVMAIIDDSLETTHVDLAGNVLGSGRCFDSPGSQRPCTNGSNDPNPADADDFHGTLVAGAAAARGNNAIGIAGAVWETDLLPLKVDLTSFAIVNAIDEAILQGSDIINMSFGGPVQGSAEREALDRALAAGVLVVAAAGNADANNDRASHFPSDSDHPNLLSVAATNSQDKIANFSQWAPFSVDIAAPGELVRSTAINDSYAVASGTSFAAPHIAGIAAMVKAETGAADYARVRAHLIYGGVEGVNTLGPVVPGASKTDVPGRVSSGRVDAARALAGPPGGVLVIRDVSVDDSVTGNANGALDPGETALLNVVVENLWSAETAVTGALSTPDAGLMSVNDTGPVLFGSISQDGTAQAGFSVTLSSTVAGNEQIFLQLDMSSATNPTLPSRYFYLEVGTLTNGDTVSQQIQRWNWDEFHEYTLNVPAGSANLNIETAASGDLDLLVRHQEPPEYLISLGGGSFYYVDSGTIVSSGPDANETVSIAAPLPGLYHIVVVNFDQTAKTYDLLATYAAPGSGNISFSADTYSVNENGGSVLVTVSRSGGVGAASVNFATAAVSATEGDDYSDVSGTLNWSAGDTSDKSFSVPVVDDMVQEATETIALALSNPTGATLGPRASASVEILDDDNVGGMLSFVQDQFASGESAGSALISVERSGDSTGTASVSVSTQAITASPGADYQEHAETLTWNDSELGVKSVSIVILDDLVSEADESFSVDLSNASGAVLGSPNSATVVISDNDRSPTASGGGGGGGAISIPVALLLLLSSVIRAMQTRSGPSPSGASRFAFSII